jgi:hypothetical protein
MTPLPALESSKAKALDSIQCFGGHHYKELFTNYPLPITKNHVKKFKNRL